MSQDEEAIRAVFKEWDEAANDGDADRWMEVFAEDAIFMAPDVPLLTGKQEIDEWVRESFFNVFDIHLNNSLVELDIAGDWACGRITGTFAGTPKAGGDTLRANSKQVAVFRKQSDGAWKYSRHIFNWESPPSS